MSESWQVSDGLLMTQPPTQPTERSTQPPGPKGFAVGAPDRFCNLIGGCGSLRRGRHFSAYGLIQNLPPPETMNRR